MVIQVSGEEYCLGTTPSQTVGDGIAKFAGRRARDRFEVSIKRYSAITAQRENAAREITIWKMLSPQDTAPHDNIVYLHGTTVLDGHVYMVRFLAGQGSSRSSI